MSNGADTDILCGLCEFKSSSLAVYKEHILSEHHMKKIPEESKNDVIKNKDHKIKEHKNKELHHCYLCNVTCNGEVCWKAHLEGSKHKKKSMHQIGHDSEKENLQTERNTLIYSNQNFRPKSQYSAFKSSKRHPYINESHHIPSLMDQEIHPPSFLAGDVSLFNQTGNISDELTTDTHGMRYPSLKRSPHKINNKPFRKSQRWNDISNSDCSQPMPSNAYEMSISTQRDIGDEIKDEMKRVQKQAQETRLAEQRRKDHMKYEEIRTFKREQMHEDTPPPPPRTLDDETKRLVMQNLVELAKCCVTNETDAELALQVSNALTQALLQYKMKNMPSSVLQTLSSVPHQQYLQQQQQYFIGNAQSPNQYVYPTPPAHQPAPVEVSRPPVAPIEIDSRFPMSGENLFPPVQYQHYQQASNYDQYFVPQNNHYNIHEQPQQHVPMQQLEINSFEPQRYEQFRSV